MTKKKKSRNPVARAMATTRTCGTRVVPDKRRKLRSKGTTRETREPRALFEEDAEVFARWRRLLEFDKNDAAEELGISYRMVDYYENGQRRLSTRTRALMKRAMLDAGLLWDNFFSGDE